jgi:hypothetical protein
MDGIYEFRGSFWPSHTNLDVPSVFRTELTGPYGGEARCQIKKSGLVVYYEPEGFDHDLFALRGFLQRLVDGIVDSICYLTGRFIQAVIEEVILPNGTECTYPSKVPQATHIDESKNLAEKTSRITELFSGESGTYLRLSLSDYTSALSNPHDTGFYCYRAIESIRQNFASKENSVADSWKLMRDGLDIKRENLDYIKSFSDDRRHGDVIEMNTEQRRKILVLTWGFISDYIDYLDGSV